MGSGAGVLAVSLFSFTLVGVLWGLLRPTYSGTLAEGGQVSLNQAVNVEFSAFIAFVMATGLLATILSLSTYITSPTTRGPGMLWWLIFVAALSSVAFIEVGNIASSLLHPIPDPETLTIGEKVTLVPALSPTIGFAAAPFMAALAYWCSALLTHEPESEQLSIQ